MNDDLIAEENRDPEAKSTLRKAIAVGFSLFFFSLVLFVGIVILIAKFATKSGGQ